MKDWLWALLIGGLAAASPHTSGDRLVPSLAGGALVSAGVLAWRRGLLARWLPAPLQSRAEGRSGLAIGLPGLVCIAAGVLVCVPGWLWLWQQYTHSIWRNGHGLFLPLVVFWMACSALRDEPPETRADARAAAPFLVVAVVLAWLGANTRLGYPGALAIVAMTPGLSLLLLGREATHRIAFPLALLVFLLPVPDGLLDPLGLSSATALLSEPIIGWLGVEALRDQTTYLLEGLRFSVSANCSGASTFYAALLLALVLGWRARPPVRVGLVLAAWPLTVLINSLRLAFIIGGTRQWGLKWVHSPIHGISGIVTFWAVLALLALVAWALAPREARAPA